MGRDEQREERDVLDSIFPEEITGKSLRPHRWVYVCYLEFIADFLDAYRYIRHCIPNQNSIGCYSARRRR